jgi:hypothetical protein
VMVLRVVATTAPRTSATVNAARISTMTTRLWRAGARCAGGRRGHSCGRGAGPRSRRRWRCTPDGSGILGRRYSCDGQVVGRTRRQTRHGSGQDAFTASSALDRSAALGSARQIHRRPARPVGTWCAGRAWR